MPVFLQEGYEESVRAKLGVKSGELPDNIINQRLVVDLAESTILKRVPSYTSLTDINEILLLEGAIISQICYQLAPTMGRRLNLEVSTVDVKWKKDKIDWAALAEIFAGEVEVALTGIESIEVDLGADSLLADYSRNERIPI
jgi:hypothetical protein